MSSCYKVKLCENHRQSFINQYGLFIGLVTWLGLQGYEEKDIKDQKYIYFFFWVTYFETRTINQIMCTIKVLFYELSFSFLDFSIFLHSSFLLSFFFFFQSWEAFDALLLWRMFSIRIL